MKSVSLITALPILMLILITVISAGCTVNTPTASLTVNAMQPTPTPDDTVPAGRMPTEEPTAMPVAAPTAAVTLTPTPTPTPAPSSSSSPSSDAANAAGKVIYDEKKGIPIGNSLAIKFDENLNMSFLQRDEKYLIEVSCTKPVNILFMQMTEYDSNVYTPPKWDSLKGEWKYTGKMTKQYDNTLGKTFEVTIPRIGKYCLFIDARNTDKDILIDRESVAADIRITKLK